MSRRPAHQGFPDRRGPRDRDGRDHGSGGDAVLAYADRPWAAARDQVAVRVSAVRNEQGRSPLVRRVGLPGLTWLRGSTSAFVRCVGSRR